MAIETIYIGNEIDNTDTLRDGFDKVNANTSDLDVNKVPYSGARGNVDLGENQLKAGQLELDQTPSNSSGVGIIRWNDTDGTADLGLKGGNVTLQIGQEQVLRVVNKAAVDLLEANYQAVKIIGATGQRLSVDLAQADSDLNSATTIGIVTETIVKNQEGFVTTSGAIREINTTGSLQSETWADGDVLYLSPTVAGKITNVKPAAPNHIIIVGYVEYAHAIHGKIFVKVDNGYELDELHNVSITTPANDQVLTYESSSALWKNKTLSTGLTIGTTAISSGTNGRILFQNAGVLQQSANLFWDNTNNRLQIGNLSSANELLRLSSSYVSDRSVRGGITWMDISNITGRIYTEYDGTMVSMVFGSLYNSGYNSNNLMIIRGNGNVGIGTNTPTSRLHVAAQGALSTDVALRVRNSANTGDLLNVLGNGNVQVGVGGLSICRTDSPNGSLLGTITYRTDGTFGMNLPLTTTKIVSPTSALSFTQLDGFQHIQQVTGSWADAPNAFVFQSTGAQGLNSINNNFLSVINGASSLFVIKAQGNVGIGTATVVASAKVQIDSTTQGFLPPRMTNAQRIAIASPAVGLMVYCTDMVEGLYVYKSTGWTFII